jgi:hypothetical protein
MKLRKLIETTIKEFLNENKENVDLLLDKINMHGKQSLTFDERTYLKQFNDNNINPELEEWIFSDDESTFDLAEHKLLFDEFEEDDDIFYNKSKLKRVITKHLGKKPFTNNADWNGGYAWNLKTNENFTGTFLYLGDDELIVIVREIDVDGSIIENDEEIIDDITNSRELYNFFLSLRSKK